MKMFGIINQYVEENERAAFKRSMLQENLKRGRLFARVAICFEVFLIAVNATGFLLHVDNRFHHIGYGVMYAVMVLMSLAFLLRFKKSFRTENLTDKQLKNAEIFFVAYITLFMCWGSTVSLMDQRLYGHLMVFMVNAILCSFVFYTEWKSIAVPYAASLPILFVGLPFFQFSPDVLIGHYVNLCIFIVITWIASRILFMSYCKDYQSRIQLKKSNLLLETQMEQNKIINMRLTSANMMLEELSFIDELTKIPNRRSFRKFVELRLPASQKSEISFGVIMLDIDFFKNYNDYYGHVQGDDVLIAVANQINQSVRGHQEFAARWGGEEFIFAAFGSGLDEVAVIGHEIRKNVLALAIPHASSPIGDVVSVSLGICSRTATDRSDITGIIDCADKALYQAKITGRNRAVVYDAMQDAADPGK